MRMPLAIAVLVLPTVVGAQREPLRQATTVPVELAAALATTPGLGGSSDPQILVGELPEWLAARIHLPSGAVILGSAFAGTTVIGIVQTLEGVDNEGTELDAALARKGWRRPDPWPGEPTGGFRMPAGSAVRATTRANTYCASDRMLSVTRGSARQGKQNLVFRMTNLAPQGYGPCHPPPDRRRGAPLPILYHPAGTAQDRAVTGPDCDNGERYRLQGANGTGDRVRTALSPDSLLSIYGRQLADSGWTSGSGSMSVSRFWTRSDSAGRKQMIEIKVGTASGNPMCRDLSLMLYSGER